jgi:hypothetical protein
MAGRAERIRNFCTSFPNSPGCRPSLVRVHPSVNPCVAAAANPLSIGTTNCDTYTYYIDGHPGPYNQNNLITSREQLISSLPYALPASNPPTSDPYYVGFKNTSVANLFSDSNFTNRVGKVILNNTAIYDEPLPVSDGIIPGESDTNSSACVTSNVTVYFINFAEDPQTSTTYLKASFGTIFMNHLMSTTAGTGYPGNFKAKSISVGQQLVNNDLEVYSTVEVVIPRRAAKSSLSSHAFSVVNKIVITGCSKK